jgi:hypothetical protein
MFLNVSGFSDYAGPNNPLAISVVVVLLSSTRNGVGVLYHRLFEESCRPESAPELGVFTPVRASWFSEYPVASGWLAGLNGSRFFLGCAER